MTQVPPPLEDNPTASSASGKGDEATLTITEHLREVLDIVHSRITAVWPLRDYVAVNPYEGFTGRDFFCARRYVRVFSDLETLMPLAHYRSELESGKITAGDIEVAVDELRTDGLSVLRGVGTSDMLHIFRGGQTPVPSVDRRLWTMSQVADQRQQTEWTSIIVDEIGKHCSSHYDEGQSVWPSPWRNLSLYSAWLHAATIDRGVEIAGLKNFRRFVSTLPKSPVDAIEMLLGELNVPQELFKAMLLCEAYTVPGWCAWTKYQSIQATRRGETSDDLVGLLAIRLAYDVAVARQLDLKTDWSSAVQLGENFFCVRQTPAEQSEAAARLVGLRASEIAIRRTLLSNLQLDPPPTKRTPAAQLVFCIDVRSERIRRHLESTSTDIATYGFAGFFALPIAQVAWGEQSAQPQVPALIGPALSVTERLVSDDAAEIHQTLLQRVAVRGIRASLKAFQRSAIGSFGFVESLGIWFGAKMIGSAFGVTRGCCNRDGLSSEQHAKLLTTRDGWTEQGFGTEKQIAMAAGMLRGIGLTSDFASIVVLCGHGSSTQNNPLAAGLDCGACGGHSGQFNARVGVMLLNDPEIRAGLAAQGITVPSSTHFVAAVHNTTTDEITVLDPVLIPSTHRVELQTLQAQLATATKLNQAERASENGMKPRDWFSRASDWSEVRPEWGLAGNTSFIVGPRSMTQSAKLDGRSFMHSYDHRADESAAVLENIMTAPLVVAHWINQQYYASSVDPNTFGSGTKTIHNVVGKFGLLSGGGGDLMTGLPYQSIHDGERLRHEPVRLQAIIAAPRGRIESILAKHSSLDDLLSGGWMHLIAIDDGRAYRYGMDRQWREFDAGDLERAKLKSSATLNGAS